MKINIHELKKKSEVTFKGEQPISLRGLNSEHPIQNCEAHVDGTVTKTGNRYLVQGTVSVTVQLLCDRCIEEFDCSIVADLYKEYSSDPNVNEDDEDIIQVTDSEIDLEDAVTEAVYLNLPMKWVHDDKCKGICKVCGQNLNKHQCKCQENDIDPRLEGLKNIFHPQSEE